MQLIDGKAVADQIKQEIAAEVAEIKKNGGKTPVAGIIHAITLLLILLFAGKYAAFIPMAALAAVLINVAWNMAELPAIKSLLKGQKSDIFVFITTLIITVLIDLTVAIEAPSYEGC